MAPQPPLGRNPAAAKPGPKPPEPTGLNRKYLRIQDLRRLSRVAFAPRRRIEGLYAGRHATPMRGQSIEFRDYRQYIPGDDVGGIDWKVYGRSDRLYIRLFEHQAEMTIHLLVDGSASMGYHGLSTRPAVKPRKGRRPPPLRTELSKFDQACFLAAGLGFVLAKQHDRFSFGIAQQGLSSARPPGNSLPHLVGILKTMEQTTPYGRSALPAAIRALAATAGRRDLLMVFSDLLDDRTALQEAFSSWLHRGGEVIVFQTLHEHELTLPDLEHGVFVDSETGATIRLNVDDVRQEYESRITAFLQECRKGCGARGIDYNLVSTADPYQKALERYLVNRASL